MSFTQDELQSFNTILEQQLSLHRRELERAFDQRINILRREFEQRLTSVQQDLMRSLPQRLSELHSRLSESLHQRLDLQQTRITQAARHRIEQTQQVQQQYIDDLVERSLAAQLHAIEQLIHQRLASQPIELPIAYKDGEAHADFEALEVQTEISWDDLADVINKVLDERLSALTASIHASFKQMEEAFLIQLHTLRADLMHGQGRTYSGKISTLQDVFTSIEQLEHIIESMQVAMTNNHALLSNRLYHHQQLPLERAHPGSPVPDAPTPQANGSIQQLPLSGKQDSEA